MVSVDAHPLWKKTSRALLLLAWVMGVFLGVQVVIRGILEALIALGVSFEGVNEAVFSSVVGVFIYTITIITVIGVPWLLGHRTTKEQLGLSRSIKAKDYGWLGIGAVAYFTLTIIISSLAMILLPMIDFEEQQVTGYESIANNFEYVLAFIGLVIVAPVAEEVLFRGYLFGKLRAAQIRIWVSVLLVSLLFAVAHFQGNVGVDTFALSIVLCFLRVFTGSIWSSIMLHMFKNGIAYYFLFINPTFLSTLGG